MLINPGRFLLWSLASASCTLVSATEADANWRDYCPQIRIQGSVESITAWTYRIDRKTGKPIGDPIKTSDTTVSRDRRNVTEVLYENDIAMQVPLRIFPTHLLEYEADGRLISDTLQLDGREAFSTTRCEYDAVGRASNVTQQSKNPDLDNRKISYTYGDRWRSQKWQSPWATIVTTQYLDDKGRPMRETRVAQSSGENSVRTFEHLDGVTRVCQLDPNLKHCTDYRYDSNGNQVDSRSEVGFRTVTYEYDRHGNWILELVESATIGGTVPYRNVELRRRDIKYRPD